MVVGGAGVLCLLAVRFPLTAGGFTSGLLKRRRTALFCCAFSLGDACVRLCQCAGRKAVTARQLARSFAAAGSVFLGTFGANAALRRLRQDC